MFKLIGIVLGYLMVTILTFIGSGVSGSIELFVLWFLFSGFFVAYKLISSTKESRQRFIDWLNK